MQNILVIEYLFEMTQIVKSHQVINFGNYTWASIGSTQTISSTRF